MSQCPIHGPSPFAICCEHIADAVVADRPMPARILVDWQNDPTVVCAPCWTDILHRTAKLTTWIFRDLEDQVSAVAVCHACLATWYADTGQGDLDTAITRTRDELPS